MICREPVNAELFQITDAHVISELFGLSVFVLRSGHLHQVKNVSWIVVYLNIVQLNGFERTIIKEPNQERYANFATDLKMLKGATAKGIPQLVYQHTHVRGWMIFRILSSNDRQVRQVGKCIQNLRTISRGKPTNF